MFVCCSEISISVFVEQSNILELSGLFVCLEGLVKVFSARRTKTIAGLWISRRGEGDRGVSTQTDTMVSHILLTYLTSL